MISPPVNEEIERRFVVEEIDQDIYTCPATLIQQSYLRPGVRVRIYNGERAELTRKEGTGLVRTEFNDPLDVNTARTLMLATDLHLQKTRYRRGRWEVDVFDGPLTGLIVAEIELTSPDEVVTLPSWIRKAREVTDSLSNEHLALTARNLRQTGSLTRPIAELLPRAVPRVVLTGPPGSGKSTAIDVLRTEFAAWLHCVPEVASIVISQVGVTPPMPDDVHGTHTFQRNMTALQIGFEDISADEVLQRGKKAQVLDRGIFDNAAYLPGGREELNRILGGQLDRYYGRYTTVICLAAPPKDVFERIKRDNPARREEYDDVLRLEERIEDAWSEHPNCILTTGRSMSHKLSEVRNIVRTLLA